MKAVVVGAGLAGLTAAYMLEQAGVEVSVIESSDRVGGRTVSAEIAPGRFVDLGGAYAGTRHLALGWLLRIVGLETVPIVMRGRSTFELRDAITHDSRRFPPLNAVALGDMFERLEELSSSVDLNSPWIAERYDNMSAKEWADANLKHSDAALFFPLFLGEMMAACPESVSALHVGFYLKSGGGMRYLNAFEGGAQESRIAPHAQEVSVRLARALKDVRLNSRVFKVDQDARGVTVHSTSGELAADYCVVAVPLHLRGQIRFAGISSSAPSAESGGSAIKVHAIYAQPHWRKIGLSGWSLSDRGPLLSTVDDSLEEGGLGVLTGFIAGASAAAWARRPVSDLEDSVVQQLRRLFPNIPVPDQILITNWLANQHCRGCYASLLSKGDWQRVGKSLRGRSGRVCWAGTEQSAEFYGLMEGAVRSGIRAANEISARCGLRCASIDLDAHPYAC